MELKYCVQQERVEEKLVLEIKGLQMVDNVKKKLRMMNNSIMVISSVKVLHTIFSIFYNNYKLFIMNKINKGVLPEQLQPQKL